MSLTHRNGLPVSLDDMARRVNRIQRQRIAALEAALDAERATVRRLLERIDDYEAMLDHGAEEAAEWDADVRNGTVHLVNGEEVGQ